MAQKLTVCVLFGGQSSEHEVSRVSAASVINNLDKEKYDVVMIGITKKGKWYMYQGPVDKIGTGEWENGYTVRAMISPDASVHGIIRLGEEETARARIDVVFPVLHGLYGEDGTIQGLLKLAGIPCVGPGVLASAISMDKAYTRIVFDNIGLPQAKYLPIYKDELELMDMTVSKIEEVFTYPCFVKPANAGSSMGISKAHNREELKAGLISAAEHDTKVLVEEFINGREVECAVLGNKTPKTSVLGEIIPATEFYDYDAKYNNIDSKLIIPAQIPEDTSDKIKAFAIEAYKALDCRGLARVDFFVHKETGEVYINEVNTMPGFTDISMYPKLWEASGIKYSELLDELIQLATE